MKAQILIQERLRQRMLEAKLKNPQVSVRGLAKQLKLPAGTVSLVLLGKRKLSSKLAMKFADALYFDPMERARLEAAFSTEKKPSRKSKGSLLSKSETEEKFKPEALKLSADQFHVMKDWYYFAILNLTYTDDFKNEPEWIASRLNLKPEEVTDAIERLENLGLLKVNTQGKLKRTHKQLSTSDQIQNLSLRYSHYQNLELAKKSLDQNEINDRDFSWLTLPVNFDRMNEMKIMIREFQDQFLEKFGEEKNVTEVVRVAVQLFPLTTIKPKTNMVAIATKKEKRK